MNKDIKIFFDKSANENVISNHLYKEYDVKKGLRNEDGTGVLVGLTTISDVVGYKRVDGKKVDDFGTLYYRGIDIKDIISKKDERLVFEEVFFLILFGYLPSEEDLKIFIEDIKSRYTLPKDFLQSKILRHPAKNLMNKLQQDVLALFAFDENPDDIGVENTLEQGLNLVARLFSIAIYNYHVKVHHFNHESLYIHHINDEFSIAENILHLLRPNQKFTSNEVSVLDTVLVLHVDHGGGNNSTFTNVVISSTGTDIYSTYAGSIGSLKGPRHGGANLAVKEMMNNVIAKIGLSATDEEIKEIIMRILDKDFHDNTGLVYGIGHAIYTLSDPRSEIMSEQCYKLAVEKNRQNEYDFYKKFEAIAIDLLQQRKGINVCSNVDFFSGLVYDMLEIPPDLYPLLFVVSRSVGWLAHNIEDKLFSNRIVRPATKYVGQNKEYKNIDERK